MIYECVYAHVCMCVYRFSQHQALTERAKSLPECVNYVFVDLFCKGKKINLLDNEFVSSRSICSRTSQRLEFMTHSCTIDSMH